IVRTISPTRTPANSISCNRSGLARDRMHFDQLNRRALITLLGGAAAVCFGSALAQQPGRVWRIGILHGVPQDASIGVAAFRQRLGELGYLEGSKHNHRVPVVRSGGSSSFIGCSVDRNED